ncbi:BtpA/SgcQ family protein [Streptomyces sp. PKU-EA00015]|uniref:BtpA/SgcQ family protein n=1 Tax=Streptomyces sp. PKU-EA00015 TaxID=2748326 RepID=UPI0015A05C4C|nr:BtpA/SgcQ family protein [Streptomyces sp. PKU-EA00015]NWF29766.1 BtpA/SgcQ family protein [Streptomyces sp. PKU-EA00015]
MLTLPEKAVIACVHLPPTPGSPGYDGKIDHIYDSALRDAEVFLRHGVDALIVENFRDAPFHPDTVPVETTATVAGVTREVVRMSTVPTGVAVLRNDASAALAVATATGADFIRVNVHVGAVLSEQGLLTGRSHETLRLRRALGSDVAIFADARVKHSQPFVYQDLATEVRDLSQRADGIIVSGELTGLETSPQDLLTARRATAGPLLVGSGVTPGNLACVYEHADGFIVGSYFKVDGVPGNPVDESRVADLMERVRALRSAAGTHPGDARA